MKKISLFLFAIFLIAASCDTKSTTIPSANLPQPTLAQNFQTYTDQKYGFSFQYPDTKNSTKQSNTNSETLDFHSFVLYVNNPGIGFEGMDLISNENKIINGIAMHRISYGNVQDKTVGIITYEFSKDKNDYLFFANTTNISENSFDAIVSTFKFTQ